REWVLFLSTLMQPLLHLFPVLLFELRVSSQSVSSLFLQLEPCREDHLLLPLDRSPLVLRSPHKRVQFILSLDLAIHVPTKLPVHIIVKLNTINGLIELWKG